jgi:putative FmdB family regulatory protein
VPTYAYKCSNDECHATHDLTTSMEQRGTWQGKTCPTCGDGTLRRLFTPYRILNAGLGDII